MRTELKGIHAVTHKLRDGSNRTYYYAWRGGPRIEATPNTPELLIAYRRAHETRTRPSEHTVKGLIAKFFASEESFGSKSAASQKAYRSYLRLIEEEFGAMPLEAAQDRRARGDFKQWRDSMAATPRKADYAWTTLVRLLSFGVDRGLLTMNVCARGGRLYKADRRDLIWTSEHIERFIATAGYELQLALVLGLWTGQRQGDLLKVTWTAYDGKTPRFRQSKTGARVAIPVGDTLRDALTAAPRRAATILTTQGGTTWTSDGFRASWRKACERAGIADVTFHDIRGSAVVRLALAGCEVPEIAAITGHALKDASAILDAHYLGRVVELAERAMRKRELNERVARDDVEP